MKPRLLLSALASGLLLPATLSAHVEPTDSLRTQNLDQVTVYGTRVVTQLKKIPSKVELIQTPDIVRASVTNLGDLLKTQSSVDIIQYPGFNSTVGLRGFSASSGKYVTLLVDGIPAGTTNISTLGLSDLQQVEVLKGPFSAIYGTGAMGGVINLVTQRNKEALTGRASIAGGSYGSLRGALNLGGRIAGGLSFDLGLNYTEQLRDYKSGTKNILGLSALESAILDDSTRGTVKHGSAYSAIMGRLRLGYDFSPLWSLNLYQSLFTTEGLGIGGNNWSTNLTSKDINRYSASLELLGRAGNHALQLRPYYNVEKNENYDTYRMPSPIASYSSTVKTFGALLQDNISLGVHQLAIGLDAKRLDTDARRYNTSSGAPIKPYNPAYATTSLGAYAQANLSFLEDRLLLSAGARLDHMIFDLEANDLLGNASKTEKHLTVSPNLGLKYELLPGLRLHASAGAGFLAPDAYQKSGEYIGSYSKTRGNPDLKPERSFTVDFGFGYSNHKAGLQADVSYFQTRHRDLIVSTPADAQGFRSYTNADKSRMSGIEVLFSYDLGSLANYAFSLRAFANATFILQSEMYLNNAWSDIYYVRKQNVTFGLEYRSKGGLELALRGRFAGKRIEQNWNTYGGMRPTLPRLLQAEYPELAAKGLLPYPPTMTFDLSAHYTIFRSIRLGAHLNNLLDEHYAEKDGYNMIGRNFLVTLGFQF